MEETAKGNAPNIMTHCYPNITCLHQEPLRRKTHFGKGINIIINKKMERFLCFSQRGSWTKTPIVKSKLIICSGGPNPNLTNGPEKKHPHPHYALN